ncbi:aspartate/glutamate racemase family protein (plasmid) [Roseomonas gilardii subsp. gilardii]|uniref:aspartate/glutamate racemase family protein n=1 Tax=Roseomonas gilardii TaxID=257708 RepID=UPI001FFB3E9A|nr:aspartate/glutamate racemase family protein [Roseomonas gilardii]UPG74586.1 aspartate/glutamate racemase family protein [Roseomonas gilardii subsp. gilardii]
MSRILVINPNRSASCTGTIRDSVQPLVLAHGPRLEVVGLPEGPPAIATWRDWHAVAEPLCRLVEAEPAAAYVIACVSDPAIDLLRSVTPRPVLGALRSGIAAAVARGERFGIVAFVEASVQRQRRVLQTLGLEARCVASLPLDLPMEVLTSAEGPRPRLLELGQALKERGADSVILGCAGMAGHRRFLEEKLGLPVIEPCQAAVAQALLATLS